MYRLTWSTDSEGYNQKDFKTFARMQVYLSNLILKRHAQGHDNETATITIGTY